MAIKGVLDVQRHVGTSFCDQVNICYHSLSVIINCLMDFLQPIPEIGVCKSFCVRCTVVCDDTCDICMTRKASIFCSCNIHKMCCRCCCRLVSMRSCPLCGSLRVRSLEKQTGRPYITPSTHMPLTRYGGSSTILPIITDEVNSDAEQDEDLFSTMSDSTWSTSYLSDCSDISICSSASDSKLSDSSRLLTNEFLHCSHEESFLVPQEYEVESSTYLSHITRESDSNAILRKSPLYTYTIPLGF